MNLKRFVIISLLAAGTILFCIRWVDGPVALILQRTMPHGIASRAEAVPDLLFPITLAISIASWTGYGWLTWKKSKSRLRSILAIIGLASLLSFATKYVLQALFGRINPRQWLASPSEAQFRFLGAGGIPGAFPSGHMSVFTPVFMTLYRTLPSMGPWWISFWAALALALIAGNYHFVSDVIAGAYLGFVSDLLSFYLALRLVKSGEEIREIYWLEQ